MSAVFKFTDAFDGIGPRHSAEEPVEEKIGIGKEERGLVVHPRLIVR